MAEDLELDPDTLALVVVDVQEKLAAAMPKGDRARCVSKVGVLLEAARLLELPVLVTEQYPKGLGHTVSELRARLDAFAHPPPVIAKRDFDASANHDFMDALEHLVTARGEGALRTLVVVGMEAHVCVYQTVRGLVGGGFAVHVPADATCSRAPEDQRVARDLWARSGAVVTGTETVLFDLMRTADHPHFRAISSLIR